jgi:hypothetical protein
LLLGAREGDEVQWLSGGALERLRIEKVLYQPGVAIPPLVSSGQASKEGMREVAANAARRFRSAEHKERMRWIHYP